MISIVIPARNEIYLQKTIDGLFERARGKIEVIVVLDGYWPDPPLKDRKNLVVIHRGKVHGMRSCINAGVAASKYDYILKLDGHCLMAEGFDTQLVEDCKEWNWALVPTRYSLDTRLWDRKINKKYEFQYISSDDLKGKTWHKYGERVKDETLIDLMTTQGSCWFMTKKWWDHIGGEDEVNYGHMGREAQEICLKTWLGGGRFVLTRNTWYAHWSKSRSNVVNLHRGEKQKSVDFACDFWLNDKWDKAVRPLSWLIEKFAPVPTWDEINWQTRYTNYDSMTRVFREIQEKQEEKKVENLPLIEQKYETEYIEGDPSQIILKGMTRAKLYQYFAELGFKKGAEIGVQRGRNAWVMFQNIPDLELILVDPYKDHPYNPRKWGKAKHERFKKQAFKRFNSNGYRVNWFYGYSEEVAGQIKDESLDFVYVDGEHFYDFAMIDLILWTRKVRKGGIVAGHDYEYHKPEQFKVYKAVNHFISACKFSPLYVTDKTVIEHPGDRAASFFFVKNRGIKTYLQK